LGVITTFHWLRHGPVLGPNTLSGRLDVACDLSDTATIAALGRALPQGAALVSSPSSRAVDTGTAALGRQPDRLEPDLMEQDFGRWSGRGWFDLTEEATALGFWDDPAHVAPPEGESFADQCRRVAAVITDLAGEHEGGDVVCACHAGTIRAALAHALGVTERPAPALSFQIDYLSLTRIDVIEAKGRIVTVNRTFS
jgi:alpha-ribazole phosphatase